MLSLKFLLTFLCTIIILLSTQLAHALPAGQQYSFNNATYSYERPHFGDFVYQVPDTYKQFFLRSFAKDNHLNLFAITVSTAILWYYDQEIYRESRRVGRRLGLGNDDHTKTIVHVGTFDVFRGPTDLASAMYFLGDGWTHFTLMLAFASYGGIRNDNRSLQTGSQLAQGLLITCLSNQVLKRSTGRESPNRSETSRGRWRFFPSPRTYNSDVSNYDAFPSGHLSTAMMSYTIISENYPDHPWIAPIGITWMSLLAFEMMNNGVHWASDYPLAIGMGYLTGKIIVNKNRKSEKDVSNSNTTRSDLQLIPIISKDGTAIEAILHF